MLRYHTAIEVLSARRHAARAGRFFIQAQQTKSPRAFSENRHENHWKIAVAPPPLQNDIEIIKTKSRCGGRSSYYKNIIAVFFAAFFALSVTGCAEFSQALDETNQRLKAYNAKLRAEIDAINAGRGGQRAARDGKTALMVAAERGDIQGIKRQLAAGANVNAKSKSTVNNGLTYLYAEDDGDTALTLAARNGHVGAVEALLAAGANVNAGGGWSCLDESDDCHCQPNPLQAAAKNGDIKLVQLLLKNGAAPNPALRFAAGEGYTSVLKLLLDSGANANHREECGWDNDPALVFAVGNGQINAVKLLLERGADPNVKVVDPMSYGDDEGESLLAIAQRNKQTGIVKLLKAAGAGKSGKKAAAKKKH